MEEAIHIQAVNPNEITFAGLTLLETMAYFIVLSGCQQAQTALNGQPIQQLMKQVYIKRRDFETNVRIGSSLVQKGVITQEQLAEAIAYHINTASPIGTALISLNLCNASDIQQAMQAVMEQK